jgi:hypothetical protein
MRIFGNQNVVLEQDVLRKIREDYNIFFQLSDEKIWCNEKSRSILARSCSSLKRSRAHPKIVFCIIDGIFLQREGPCSLGENVSYIWSALAIIDDGGGFVTGICDRSRI